MSSYCLIQLIAKQYQGESRDGAARKSPQDIRIIQEVFTGQSRLIIKGREIGPLTLYRADVFSS